MHALVEAAESQEWAHVIALTAVGRDVNLRARGNGRTALHYAAGYGEVEVADVLLRAGAEVNARDRAGMTPLSWACLKGQTDVVGMLLKVGMRWRARRREQRAGGYRYLHGRRMVMDAVKGGGRKARGRQSERGGRQGG